MAQNAGQGLIAAVRSTLERLLDAPLPAGLYVVATPIGNLGDITLRALSVLARADLVCCEDTRHSLKLMQQFALAPSLLPYHEHNGEQMRPRILAALGEGRAVALVSDAGTPLISDPGYKLVRAAREAGLPVVCLPGPSAPIAALAVAGLPTDCFLFDGFLPAKATARRARLEALAAIPATLALFETGPRLAASLADMAEALGPREAAIARELTKIYEEVRRGTLPELAAWAAAAEPKGEIVVLAGPPARTEPADAEIEHELAAALATASLSEAAREVARRLGVPRARVYGLGLDLQKRR
jgi:16S rRNA (cytidine1402-2'-O)-methyltransferase